MSDFPLGPCVAVVVRGRAYLVDSGPGLVRRAAAAERNGIAALAPEKLDIVFITHLHSDHTVGLPDLMFTPWVLERHLRGKYSVAPAAPGWVQWVALDIDAHPAPGAPIPAGRTPPMPALANGVTSSIGIAMRCG